MEQTEGRLLRIYISETDRYEHQPLYEWLIHQAHEHRVACAQVVRGMMGYHLRSPIHSAHILSLSEDLPLTVEMIDSPDRIEAFLSVIGSVIRTGVVTCANVQLSIINPQPKEGNPS